MDLPSEMSADEQALWDMDDDQLEAAFKEAKSEEVDPTDEIAEVIDDEIVGSEEEIDTEKEEELEQPDAELDEADAEDSDETDDTQVDGEGEADDEDNKDSDEEDLEADKQTDEESEDNPEDNSEEVKEEPVAISKYKIKANGMDLELTNEELIKLAPKALDYTKKMQEISPWRKTISALKDNDMTEADVNLMIDIMKGDKDAITSVIKKYDIDTMDIDTENAKEYTPTVHGKSETELNIQDVESRISGDAEYATTRNVLVNQWDQDSWNTMTKDPNMIEGLHADVKSGVFDKVSPIALKLKALDNGRKSDVDYYVEAGSEYYGGLQAQETATANAEAARVASDNAKVAQESKLASERAAVDAAKEAQAKQKEVKKASKSRKAAAPTKKAAGKRNVIDYLEDSDEAYDEWYDKLQKNY